MLCLVHLSRNLVKIQITTENYLFMIQLIIMQLSLIKWWSIERGKTKIYLKCNVWSRWIERVFGEFEVIWKKLGENEILPIFFRSPAFAGDASKEQPHLRVGGVSALMGWTIQIKICFHFFICSHILHRVIRYCNSIMSNN